MKINDPFAGLRALHLPAKDFAVFGSGPLIVRQLIEPTNDVDVICRGAAWEAVQTLGELTYLEAYDVHIVALDDGRLTFGDRWAIGDPDIDRLIDTAEQLDGLPFVRLEHVIAYKQQAGREKDLAHLDVLRKAGLLS